MRFNRRQAVSARIIGLVSGCAAAWLFHCTTSLTGGNSSETTNVAVLTENGSPAAFAMVKLIDGGNWARRAADHDILVLDSAMAGPDGIVSFARLPDASCNLQIDYPGSGMLLRYFCDKGKIADGTDTVRLRKYAALRGACSASDGLPSLVMLEGTAYAGTVNDGRSFFISGVAPGVYPLMFGSASGDLALAGRTVLSAGDSAIRNADSLSFSSLLIDDFEIGDSTSVLAQFTGGGWYSFTDVSNGGKSTIVRTFTRDAPQGTFAMNADIVLRSNPVGVYAGTGMRLGIKRGRNTMRVSVESSIIDSIQPWPDFGRIVTLDSTWRHIRIPVDSLALLPSKALNLGITWAMTSKRISRIEFEASPDYCVGDTIQIQLDDIRFEGVSASAFFKQLNPAGTPE